MTTPDLPADRPIPDTDDLRLLAELINNAYIPLANAAWNARMSQAEAALRLVSMAERGLPLRLVADGDRQALWHIAQAGPATSGVPVTGGQPPASPGGDAPPAGQTPTPAAGPDPGNPVDSGPLSQAPPPASGPPAPVSGAVPSAPPPSGEVPPVAVQLATAPPIPAAPPPAVPPPASPVPPHEQAIAGAVPLGEPPFGLADSPPGHDPAEGGSAPAGLAPPAVSEPAGSEPPASHEHPAPSESVDQPAPSGPEGAAGSTWGPAGSASWAGQPAGEATSDPGDRSESPAAPTWTPQHVTGPAGEQLVVSILEVSDPADRILTDAGFRMDPGQRAVLVHSSVANTGEVPYHPVGDLYLVLETDQRVLLGRANVAVASHPAFGVGVPPGRTADGWSVFLIPSETVLAGLKWCIRPDIPQTIVSWPIAP